jgi:hypothetical protein
MSPQELEELLAVCRKYDVTVFTDGKVRIAFGPSGQQIIPHKGAHDTMVPVPTGQRRMTDTERFLFAATEGYPVEDEDAVVEVGPQ